MKEISVWDTYVMKQDGTMMHFDILVPATVQNKDKILAYGNSYLASRSIAHSISSSDYCQFCHIEQPDEKVLGQIEKRGFAIIELENCQ